jgi:hypothetical protein
MAPSWIIRHLGGLSRFVISFPGNVAPDPLPPYLTVTARETTEVLRTATRRGAAGDQAWVSPASRLPDRDPLTAMRPASVWRYQWYRIRTYGPLQLVLLGAIVGLIGLWIEASLALGQYVLLFTFNESAVTWFRFVSFIMKALGVLIPVAVTVVKENA